MDTKKPNGNGAVTGFDLAALDTKAAAEQGTAVQLENPITGEPLIDGQGDPVTITVLGMDSAKMRHYMRTVNDRHLEQFRRQKNPLTSEHQEKEKIEGLAKVTVGWSGIALDGHVLEFNEANARMLYSDPRFPWIVEQLDKAVADRARFFKAASAS